MSVRHLPRCAALLLVCLLCVPTPAHAEDGNSPQDEKTRAAELIAGFKDKDASVRVKAAEAAGDQQYVSLTSALARLLTDRELGVRLAAIESLGKREEKAARKKAAASLGARLTHLSKQKRADPEEVLTVIDALGSLGQPSSLKPLLDPIRLDTPKEEAAARIDAVAHIPCAASVEALIDFLAKGRRGGRQQQRKLAHKALTQLTGSNPSDHKMAGRDADRWRAWWKDHKKGFDFQALADARAEAAARKQAAADRKKKKREAQKKKNARRKKGGGEATPKKPPAAID